MITQTINDLQTRAQAYPTENFNDRIEAIATEFRYMSDFMMRNGNDPGRHELYAELKARLRHIAYDLDVRSTLMEQPYIKAWHRQLLNGDTSAETLQSALLADATPERHHESLYLAFMALLTSYHWGRQQQEEWTVYLVSQQVSVIDRATLVSALTLSAIEHFDKYKAACLASVYAKATDPMVRERAYVGCLLSLNRISDDEMTEVRKPVLDILGTVEVAELFMQMISCTNALADAQEIRKELIPNILRNQPYEIKDGKIIEKGEGDDNEAGKDYDPDEENASLDAMEDSVKRMIKMQKNGSDIFFEGFRQMKRFPFFQKFVNWFTPYYNEHPDIPKSEALAESSNFIERVTTLGPFCESDKYSFVIAMTAVLKSMPENVRTMMENGEMGPLGMHQSDDDMLAPSLLRLQYLQDLYRFYNICPLAEKMYNPFSELNKCYIGVATATHTTDKEKRNLCLYLLKKDKQMPVRNTVARLLNRFIDRESFDRHYCHAELKLLSGDYPVAVSLYNKCLELKPGNTSCLRSLAKAYYLGGDYEKAAFYYDALHTLQPDRLSYSLNFAMAMTMDGKADEVINELFRLDFEHPDNLSIMNTLVWTLLHAGKTEQALSTAQRMMKNSGAVGDFSVCLNAAYAQLAMNNPVDAVETLRLYYNAMPSDKQQGFIAMLMQSMNADAALLGKYSIGEAEMNVIASQI